MEKSWDNSSGLSHDILQRDKERHQQLCLTKQSRLISIKNGENVGNSYNSYIINDLLRTKFGYDGVVCTYWGITEDPTEDITKMFPDYFLICFFDSGYIL